jgi:hypothetical protein
MTYIPQNKIKTNLYTSGDEFTYLNSTQIYIGYYHKLYNGKYFTGATPNFTDKKEIVVAKGQSNSDYKNFIGDGAKPSISFSPILPTQQDYSNGEFTRYFSIKRNQPIFTEINKNTYTQFQKQSPDVLWKLYRTFSLFWKLTGTVEEVAQVNKNIVELTEQREKALGLGLYLKENYTQYYK